MLIYDMCHSRGLHTHNKDSPLEDGMTIPHVATFDPDANMYAFG